MFYAHIRLRLAVHQFLLEVHVNAWGLSSSYTALGALEVGLEFANNRIINETDCDDDPNCLIRPYNGQYDNLLFFFTHMYKLIHTYYDHNDLISYRRPIN